MITSTSVLIRDEVKPQTKANYAYVCATSFRQSSSENKLSLEQPGGELVQVVSPVDPGVHARRPFSHQKRKDEKLLACPTAPRARPAYRSAFVDVMAVAVLAPPVWAAAARD